MWKRNWKFGSKYGISNRPDVYIFDDPCLSKFEHSAGHVRIPEDNL